jgi:hypothetical protein
MAQYNQNGNDIVADTWLIFKGSKAQYDMIQREIALSIEDAMRGAPIPQSPLPRHSPFLASGVPHHVRKHHVNEHIKSSFSNGFKALSKKHQQHRKNAVAAAAERVRNANASPSNRSRQKRH